MPADDYVLVHGARATRATLRTWNDEPGPVLRSWLRGALAVAVGLLAGVVAVASLATPDPTRLLLPGLGEPADAAAVAHLLLRNSLVLALHATACVAGFIAGSSLPLATERRNGLSRWVHEKARPIALGWVIAVTCFSLLTQAYLLGSTGASLAMQLQIPPATLVLTVLPHALPELVALFLPLAAWGLASRRGEWDQLLAATLVTVVVAVPVLILAALWETYVWTDLVRLASPVR